MEWQAWFTGAVVVSMLVAMATERVRPESGLGLALSALMLSGVVSSERALGGFANEGVLTVGLLFVVAAAVRRSGALAPVVGMALGRASNPQVALLRMMVPVAAISGIVNNTPLVAMLMPELRSWARRHGVAPSRLLLPLSYAAMLGGLLTVLGTSTNLVVNGLLVEWQLPPIAFAEIGRIGLPIAVAGIALLTLGWRWLLVDRPDSEAAFADPRAFTTELEVLRGGGFDGKAISECRLADGSPLLPVEICRDLHILSAPRLDEVLVAGDRLVIAGGVASVAAALRTAGLRKAVDSSFDTRALGQQRSFFEIVVAERCPLIGHRVGNGSFRKAYGAAVLALSRQGQRVQRAAVTTESNATDELPRAEGWILQGGDTLLVEATPEFIVNHRFHPHFHVVSSAELDTAPHPRHAVLAIGALLGLVGLAALDVLPVLHGAVATVGLLMLFGSIDRKALRESVDLGVLFAIACSFGVGAAIADSGLADAMAHMLVGAASADPHAALVAVLLATMIATELLSNNAAAVLMLPIALATARGLHVELQPFAIAVMVGASASFITPMGYQTNLMVFGPGGYRFADFVRAGVPMSAMVLCLSSWLIPVLWPLRAVTAP